MIARRGRETVIYYQTDDNDTKYHTIVANDEVFSTDTAIYRFCQNEKVLAIYEVEITSAHRFVPEENKTEFVSKELSSKTKTDDYKNYMKRENGEFTRIIVNDRRNTCFNLFFDTNAEAQVKYDELIKEYDPEYVTMI